MSSTHRGTFDLHWFTTDGLYSLREVGRALGVALEDESLQRRLRACAARHALDARAHLAGRASIVLSEGYGADLRRLVSDLVS